MDGLDPSIALAIHHSTVDGVPALMKCAEQSEVYLKRSAQQSPARNVRPKIDSRKQASGSGSRPQPSQYPTGQIVPRFTPGATGPWCRTCRMPHTESECRRLNQTCLRCGSRDHWIKEGFRFDALYTGYLGSLRQIEIVKSYFSAFAGDGTVKIVDPAMADNGNLYVGFDKAFAGFT